MKHNEQKERLITVLHVVENLCRDVGVWEWLWHILIDEFKNSKETFYNNISSPLAPFDSQSINERIKRIELFMEENFDKIYYDTPLNYPEDIFEDHPFSGEEFLEELFLYFSKQPKGIRDLVHYIIRQMASENTYSYIDDGVVGKKRPHFDHYKEDLAVISLMQE
jgi:hypothetical protein